MTTNDTSRQVATSDDNEFSLTIEDALALYAAAGIARTPRSIQRYCVKQHLNAHRIETEFGEKYLITRASVEKHISYIKEVTPATGRDRSRQMSLRKIRTTYAGPKWLLGPITREFPWRRKLSGTTAAQMQVLTSNQTVIGLLLVTADGQHAVYEKTADYVVTAGLLNSYSEAVTSSRIAHSFSTELGVILETAVEHGFYVSQIDLGLPIQHGARFRNSYRALLENHSRPRKNTGHKRLPGGPRVLPCAFTSPPADRRNWYAANA